MPKKKLKRINPIFESSHKLNGVRLKKIKLTSFLLIFFLTLFVLLLVYICFFFAFKTNSSLTEHAKSLLTIPRDDLESTLVVFEGSEDRLVGAWYVVHNRKNAFTMVYYIPTGVYMKDYLHAVTSSVSVGELKYIGKSLDQSRDKEYAIWQLGNLTGMTPDCYIWINSASTTSASKMFSDIFRYNKEKFSSVYSQSNEVSNDAYLLNSFFDKYGVLKTLLHFKDSRDFFTGIDTNLSTFSLLKRIREIKSELSGKDVYMLDLTQPWATYLQKQVSGKDISLINYSEVDTRLDDVVKNLKGRKLEKEQVKIEIYNASDIDGLALRYSRKFSNSGIDVVRYENSPTLENRTKIYIPKPDVYSSSYALVKKLLAVDAQVIYNRPDFMTTGDIVVIIGKDIADQVSWK